MPIGWDRIKLGKLSRGFSKVLYGRHFKLGSVTVQNKETLSMNGINMIESIANPYIKDAGDKLQH